GFSAGKGLAGRVPSRGGSEKDAPLAAPAGGSGPTTAAATTGAGAEDGLASGFFRTDTATSGIGSPGWPKKPTVLCTGTLRPGATTILSSVPSSKLSTSITDLSVSTVKRMSPLETRSPSFLRHSTIALSSVI